MCVCNPKTKSQYCKKCLPDKTDATIANELRMTIGALERLMNTARKQGITVQFSIDLIGDEFKASSTIRRVTVEEL